MAEVPAWKKALKEPNAAGWIAFVILIVAIAVGSVLFGPGGQHLPAKRVNTSQVAK
jgi:hypothetical protein